MFNYIIINRDAERAKRLIEGYRTRDAHQKFWRCASLFMRGIFLS